MLSVLEIGGIWELIWSGKLEFWGRRGRWSKDKVRRVVAGGKRENRGKDLVVGDLGSWGFIQFF